MERQSAGLQLPSRARHGCSAVLGGMCPGLGPAPLARRAPGLCLQAGHWQPQCAQGCRPVPGPGVQDAAGQAWAGARTRPVGAAVPGRFSTPGPSQRGRSQAGPGSRVSPPGAGLAGAGLAGPAAAARGQRAWGAARGGGAHGRRGRAEAGRESCEAPRRARRSGHGGTMDDLGEFRAAPRPLGRGGAAPQHPGQPLRPARPRCAPQSRRRLRAVGPGPGLAPGDVSLPAERAGPPGSPRRTDRAAPGPLGQAALRPPPPDPARAPDRRCLSVPAGKRALRSRTRELRGARSGLSSRLLPCRSLPSLFLGEMCNFAGYGAIAGSPRG